MSFGGVMIDQHGFTDRFPGTAMLTGLIANALGWRHEQFDELQRLQERIAYAARWDSQPQEMVDYHTVDLSQPKMRAEGWTTRGVPERRGGGSKLGTHQRYRHYWVDGLMTVVLHLKGEDAPDLQAVQEALQHPARPLFLGRKTCLPARPLLDPLTPVVEGDDLLAILRKVPVWGRDGTPRTGPVRVLACWPAELGVAGHGEIRQVYDLRDWANQIPAGSRWRAEGLLEEVQP